jgi:hypothetical protein
MDKKKEAAGNTSAEESRFTKLVKIADMALKLTPALATGLAAWIAYDFQARSAGVSLLNQREQAETQLRASMFDNLISPIAGPIKDKPLSADQERVLVELLTLNFHEHVEFKPLLLHVDKRLALESKTPTQAEDARRSLRSVVRRVLDRQLAVLQKDCVAAWGAVQTSANAGSGASADTSNLCREEPMEILYCDSIPTSAASKMSELMVGGASCLVISADNDKTREAVSPDGKYTLSIAVGKADWNAQSFGVNTLWAKASQPVNAITFDLTRYDLPFTDNTILDRDHRFALVVKDVEQNTECTTLPSEGNQPLKCKVLHIWVVWFPPRYILPYERPINFQEIRKILDLDSAPR